MNDDVIARLAASNPIPTGLPVRAPEPLHVRPHRLVLALALAAAVAVPAVAFAGRLGDLLGISNEGSPVSAGTIQMDQTLQDLRVGSTMQQLGTVDGVTFYATRNADGQFCLAITHVGEQYHRGVGCDFRTDGFPSADVRALTIPPLKLEGVAADGVATVAFVDAAGNTVASAPVTNNLFASDAEMPQGSGGALETLDAQGNVLSRQPLP